MHFAMEGVNFCPHRTQKLIYLHKTRSWLCSGLAYQEPMHSLREAVDLRDGDDGLETKFHVFNRVNRMRRNPLGESYRRLAQQCINCNFGYGDDLMDSGLQTAFATDFVSKLERLERNCRFCFVIEKDCVGRTVETRLPLSIGHPASSKDKAQDCRHLKSP
jgi:hypothetical protein